MKKLIYFSFFFLISCGGGGNNSSESPSPIVSISASKTTLLIAGNSILQWSSTNASSCTASGGWSGEYGISGTKTINIASLGTTIYSITCSGTGGSKTASVSISLNSDPLYDYQWHLKNTGQTNFATSSGGLFDLNIESVISSNITGSEIIIAIVDTGLEINHEDLIANVVANKSYDYSDQDNNPEPSGDDGNHGTSVAGIISAVGGNNIGIRGVAPNSKIVGFNVIDDTNNTTSNLIDALGGASGGADTNDVDIFNLSFGTGTKRYFPSPISSSVEAAYINGVNTLREGKGAIYIAAAGNDWAFRDESNTYYCGSNYGINNSAEGFSCWDSSLDTKLTIPYTIGVAAINESGVRSSYSTPGSSIWVSGFGGEFGNNSSYTGFSVVGGNTPALMTVDQSTCNKGYVKSGVEVGSGLNINPFQSGNHSENSNCNYTSTFNGSSSAAPTVSGVIALMLEANSNLTWRDIKHILASTSDQIDTSTSKIYLDVNQYSWITNSAGFKHHNWYGFGKINGANAVTASKNYILNSLGNFIDSGWQTNGIQNISFPSYTSSTMNSASINITKPGEANGKVEFVRLKIGISASVPNNIGIELISPDGTTVPVLNPYTIININPSSNAFEIGVNSLYGENMSGDWKLIISDYSNDGVGGVLNFWELKVYGN